MEKSVIVKRFQWMRNAEGNQQFGNRMEIRLLDDFAFQEFILPKLRPGVAKTLAEYQAKLPEMTHYAAIWRDGDSDWQFAGVGSVEELQKQPRSSGWALEVESFDLPEAVAFGKTADSEVNARQR